MASNRLSNPQQMQSLPWHKTGLHLSIRADEAMTPGHQMCSIKLHSSPLICSVCFFNTWKIHMSFPFWHHWSDSSFYFSNSVDTRGEKVNVQGILEVGVRKGTEDVPESSLLPRSEQLNRKHVFHNLNGSPEPKKEATLRV